MTNEEKQILSASASADKKILLHTDGLGYFRATGNSMVGFYARYCDKYGKFSGAGAWIKSDEDLIGLKVVEPEKKPDSKARRSAGITYFKEVSLETKVRLETIAASIADGQKSIAAIEKLLFKIEKFNEELAKTIEIIA